MARVRVAHPEEYDRLGPVASLNESQAVTGVALRDRDRAVPPGGFVQRFVVEEKGQISGYGAASRMPHYEPGFFRIEVVVVPEKRRRGIGEQLLQTILEGVKERGGNSVQVMVRDDRPESLRFAETRGFDQSGKSVESELLLSTFDPTPYLEDVRRLESEGIRFLSLPNVPGGQESARRRLYDLNSKLAEDDRPYDQFRRDVYESHWFLPEGQILAVRGGRFLGLTALGATAPGELYVAFTGVREEERNRGIATALKVQSLLFAKQFGAERVVTNNVAENAPMRGINAKLGFVPRPGWYRMHREL